MGALANLSCDKVFLQHPHFPCYYQSEPWINSGEVQGMHQNSTAARNEKKNQILGGFVNSR